MRQKSKVHPGVLNKAGRLAWVAQDLIEQNAIYEARHRRSNIERLVTNCTDPIEEVIRPFITATRVKLVDFDGTRVEYLRHLRMLGLDKTAMEYTVLRHRDVMPADLIEKAEQNLAVAVK